jgi:hypothetical protein
MYKNLVRTKLAPMHSGQMIEDPSQNVEFATPCSKVQPPGQTMACVILKRSPSFTVSRTQSKSRYLSRNQPNESNLLVSQQHLLMTRMWREASCQTSRSAYAVLRSRVDELDDCEKTTCKASSQKSICLLLPEVRRKQPWMPMAKT